MLPLLLLVTLLGNEHQTAPHAYAPPPLSADFAAPAVALARDSRGVAMAWSMPNANGIPRIHVARVNASGQLGTVRELPSAIGSATVAAMHPSMAPRVGADGFVITWVETSARTRAAYTLLDADLVPRAPAVLPGVSSATAPVAASGDAMWVTNDGSYWEVLASGGLGATNNAAWPASDMAVTTGRPRMVNAWSDPNRWYCGEGTGCRTSGVFTICHCKIYTYTLRLLLPFTYSEEVPFTFVNETQPAIAEDGDDPLVAWYRGDQATSAEVVLSTVDASTPATFKPAAQAPRVLAAAGRDRGPTRPDIAVSDRRTLVVWRKGLPAGQHDVEGAFIDRDGTIESLSIATSSSDERDPSVLALENGTFLVAYRKIDGKQSSIAWRVVGTPTPGRRRAVR
jgi:hypothetical protein